MSLLHNGQAFPRPETPTVGGGTISLPGDLAGSFGVVLIYRGAWCPYDNAQLASFSRAAVAFAELGIKVVALSVDDEASGSALVEKHHLHFPVGHSADPDKVAAATGAFTNDRPRHLQSTEFVLAPDGSVLTAVYSSGAIGRLVAEDVAGLVGYVKLQTGPEARGGLNLTASASRTAAEPCPARHRSRRNAHVLIADLGQGDPELISLGAAPLLTLCVPAVAAVG
jgi:peroxiredoxin